MKHPHDWPDEEVAILQQHIADRRKTRDIAEQMGRPVSSVKNKSARMIMDPVKYQRLLAYKRDYNTRHSSSMPYARIHDEDTQIRRARPSLEMLQERDRRLSVPLTPNCIILGDPPPGFSALDRRQA